ncbi:MULTISPECIES: pyridoxal-dependent decarboxylase [Streptomyces]|uniref:pyridoxal phosphate-dependent decarboxylase family protein n=1 Tax=Streptomyces TaxID=1883 RepID=UPI00161B6C04|nr:pyridoxal-dependent decarboxylase [Streptomyces sp. B15]MBQ1122321.1 aspartate aminotransferase family protein [Streptomyces sp. B15]
MSAFTVDGLQDVAPGPEGRAGPEPGPGPDTGQLLAGGAAGPAALRPLLGTVVGALSRGAVERGGPLPAGGPEAVAARVRAAVGAVLPERGAGAAEALDVLVGAVARGAADPADPLCAAHLHCPPLAVAAAADVAASALNPSLDSWDQAPAASELETLVCRALARLVFPTAGAAAGPDASAVGPDALVTTGGTEANQLALLLARERASTAAEGGGGPVRVVCGANAHHSVHRAAWLLGMAPPLVVPTPRGVLDPAALETALEDLARGDAAPDQAAGQAAPDQAAPGQGGAVPWVVATAGTTDTGAVDPLPRLAEVAHRHGALLHVDAAYGGPLLFSAALRGRLAGLERADSVTFDLHKLGWQPVAAGFLAVPDRTALGVLDHRADYLNADDDTEAGLPDLLGRSLRTTRRPDVLKVAVTLRALGRSGMARLVERTCAAAAELADRLARDERFELYARPVISTVVFRPVGGDDALVAGVRRQLLELGQAVLGRAALGGRLWWKVTLLNPAVRGSDLAALLELVARAASPGAAAGAATAAGRTAAGQAAGAESEGSVCEGVDA